jgi:4-diphosphocytidyl-2-C-methyl-D-erythritol kinase
MAEPGIEPVRPLSGLPGPIRVRVPAKINLHLAVGPLRDDGFHELTTVYQAISLYDELLAEPAERLELVVSGEGAANVPLDDSNLAARAVYALSEATGRSPNVRLTMRKGIPVAGGMAGGSADAAAALVACDALWATGMTRDELAETAAELGSDVPFALYGGTALGTGHGELLSPVLARTQRHWVIAIADEGLSTPAVFAELDRLRGTGRPPPRTAGPDALLRALRDSESAPLAKVITNDLQPAAISLRPALRRTLAAGVESGALGGAVSGSGPTCVFLAEDQEHAIRVAAGLSGLGVCRTVRTAYGPVPGARVV